ncbi:MAG: ferritin-like protein [Acidimicrobiia bacterium]
MPIESPKDLRDHLELAIQVELATIPPYLYSMYSIEDQSSEPALLIRSIVVEEMLHAALATNLLLAVGGNPDFAGTRYMTAYPAQLPHHKPPLTLDLAPISPAQIERVFKRIEQPETHGAPAQPDEFETLGQFYHALENGIDDLAGRFDLFADPQTHRQMSDSSFYRPVAFDADDSGSLLLVDDLASAVDAIETIVHQGEGMSDERWADPAHQELTHYYKLLQITEGASPLGSVRNLASNPRTADLPPTIQPVSNLFNALYRGVYLVMNRIFSGEEGQGRAVGVLYIVMADMMAQTARFLTSQHLAGGVFAGPTFEVYEFATENPADEVKDLARVVAEGFPALNTVYETIRGLTLLL